MRLILITFGALLVAPGLAAMPTEGQNAAKAVLVTGASSGIGRKITERLAADGYFVYATARKEADLKALGTIKNVQPLRLDVTQPAEIAAAVYGPMPGSFKRSASALGKAPSQSRTIASAQAFRFRARE